MFRLLSLFILIVATSACSGNPKRNSPTPEIETPTKIEAGAELPSPPPAVVAPKAAHSHSSVGAEQALGWLKNGNTRFFTNRLRRDGQSSKDIRRLADGQTPHTIVLSCSDSRVPPEIIFDQKLGEIFVVRSAGEVADTAAIASIEYALEHLGAQLILVMGHTACGAVKTAVSVGDGDAGSPALNTLVGEIQPHLASLKGAPPSADFHRETWANAAGVTQDLLTRSEIIRNRVTSGKAKIQAAVYHLRSGKVEFDAPHE